MGEDGGLTTFTDIRSAMQGFGLNRPENPDGTKGPVTARKHVRVSRVGGYQPKAQQRVVQEAKRVAKPRRVIPAVAVPQDPDEAEVQRFVRDQILEGRDDLVAEEQDQETYDEYDYEEPQVEVRELPSQEPLREDPQVEVNIRLSGSLSQVKKVLNGI